MTHATAMATGCKSDCARGYVRLAFTLSESELETIKASALNNKRSLSREIRSRLQKTIKPEAS